MASPPPSTGRTPRKRPGSCWSENYGGSSSRPGCSPRNRSGMKYKGYTGVVEFDEGAGVLFGHVIGLRGAITFQGESVAEVTRAFRDSVDDYLVFCEKRGMSPEKPFSGQFVLRIDPKLH